MIIRRPSGAYLTDAQRLVLQSVLMALSKNGFDQNRLKPLLPELLASFATACNTDDDEVRLMQELVHWVRWYRLPGYWLTYLFQAVLQRKGSIRFAQACHLYADAQIQFNEDLALVSYENGYTALHGIRGQEVAQSIEALPSFDEVCTYFEGRLREIYRYYRRWYTTESYGKIQPLNEHLANERAWNDLGEMFPTLRTSPQNVGPVEYAAVLAACGDPELVYYRVLTRQCWASHLQGREDHQAALAQLSLALEEAKEHDLEAQCGHLWRLFGFTLSRLTRYEEAIQMLRNAVAHEAHPLCGYWAALSLSELGDALLRQAVQVKTEDARQLLVKQASTAYHDSRSSYEVRVAMGVIPVARAVVQQLFRSYADNAVNAAAVTNPPEVIACIEAMGPRLCTDVVAEANVLRADSGIDFPAVRAARAIFGENLLLFTQQGTLEQDFPRYLVDIVDHRTERQLYLKARVQATPDITRAQQSDFITQKILALQCSGVILGQFYLGAQLAYMTVIDTATGRVAVAQASWSEEERTQADRAYFEGRMNALSAPKELRTALMQAAIAALLAAYEAALTSLFEQVLPIFQGKHLKIVPRFGMNEVPLHALECQGKALIDWCDVSYVPTLGVLLQVHSQSTPLENAGVVVVRSSVQTPAYDGTFHAIAAQKLIAPTILTDAAWSQVVEALSKDEPADLFFACHGAFNADDPSASVLRISAQEAVPFTRIFADLETRRCRSVLLGACESGLGRTLVSAESIGLPLAFFSAGVRYVIGTLWQVHQFATAVFTAQYFRLLHEPGHSVSSACNAAQRLLRQMTQEESRLWLQTYLPALVDTWSSALSALGPRPFQDPYYWAGFFVSGDCETEENPSLSFGL